MRHYEGQAVWMVWIYTKELNGAPSYTHHYGHIAADTAEQAIDYVLNEYMATRDGRRYLQGAYTVDSAHAAPQHMVFKVDLQPINQPEYERVIPPDQSVI